MTFQIIQGDLFAPEKPFDAIAHGVNCKGVMGAGIAVVFRDNFDGLFEEYRKRCDKFGASLAGLYYRYDPPATFGEPTTSEEHGFVVDVDWGTSVYNLFTQVYPGANADYALIERAAIAMRYDAEDNLYTSIGIPWIGCGIGGLQQHNISRIFEDVFGDSETLLTIVEQPA